IRDATVTGVQTCALPILEHWPRRMAPRADMSQARISPPSVASAGEARPDGGVSKRGTSVFLEHNLVSAVIVIAAVAALLATAGGAEERRVGKEGRRRRST